MSSTILGRLNKLRILNKWCITAWWLAIRSIRTCTCANYNNKTFIVRIWTCTYTLELVAIMTPGGKTLTPPSPQFLHLTQATTRDKESTVTQFSIQAYLTCLSLTQFRQSHTRALRLANKAILYYPLPFKQVFQRSVEALKTWTRQRNLSWHKLMWTSVL